ncbi:hypothetical protein NGM10_11960 [Halorussus salilacus]|uniref:hypothetical protein n=1 Tax=Halorussus salilacus TaxID=2953750 RepID=UPI0020A17EE3|nr:hypothetical protein [Halorussus salilacus]USZ67440.1 hypothetical protein NGM10_11960 [Halorussus salilacus]
MSNRGANNTIEQLLGTRTGGPRSAVSQDVINRVRVSANIVRQNFDELEDFVDGRLDNDALFIVYTPNGGEAASYLYKHIHNYLSSLYSFNEQIRERVNDLAPENSITKQDIISGQSFYSERLAFLRGLRHDVQHGEYNSLKLDCRHTAGNFRIYCVEFNEQAFSSGAVRHPPDYLRHTNQRDRRYPLPYIAEFHKQYFNGFVDDSVDWLTGNP